MAKWSQLPPELLEVIANRMESSICILRFRSVCTAWRAAVKPPDRFINPFPILPTNGFESLFGGFYLSKRTIFLLSLPPNSSRNLNSNVCPNYWMIKTGGISPGISHLFYPLSRTHVEPLPASFPNAIDLLNTRVHELGQEYVLEYVNHVRSNDYSSLYMEKVAFLSQKNGDCFLLTIHISGKIAMFRSADKKWVVIDEMQVPYDDVIVFNGKFYAVDNNGRTVVVGFDGADTMTLVAKPVFGGDRKCLVKSGQDLLLVDIYNAIPIVVDDADHDHDGHGDSDLG
ncbi:hypothetical protein Nepgr_004773 [Nepenthes gracilis]|uniref:F-box domain-containing protein n=1 Tax=Nepenthes gracilis TaxID=150966 RepID=A0AAD3S2A5_NEPGR|nr:hypothetical protein Nepgr_004773 [Nepenthes gracilis]